MVSKTNISNRYSHMIVYMEIDLCTSLLTVYWVVQCIVKSYMVFCG